MKMRRPNIVAGCARRRDGAAMVIVLCFLVILCAVLLGLFSSARNDLVNSRVFSGGQADNLLADTAVNLVEGQITAASTQPQMSWASQPGMIHAYDTASGNTAYKLYSSGTMVDPNWVQDAATEAQNMEGWKASSDTTTSYNAVWCDLNAPAVVNRTNPTNTAVTISTPVFPIVDPGAMYMNGAGVVGFGFVTNGTGLVAGTSAPASATDPNRRVPMPVEWIYVLKNGTLIAPSSPTYSSTATFTGTVPTASNPIIGRIAFWADDDTCKLNINTASEGTYWDMPRATLRQDWLLGFTTPIVGEFQAIGGHPATTCLDPVLGDLLPRPALNSTSGTMTDSGGIATLNVPFSSGSYANFQPYYAMNPRINDSAVAYNIYSPSSPTSSSSTSQGGTVNTLQPDYTNSAQNNNLPIVIYKTDRLYATPDELLFNPNRGFNPNWSDNTTNNSTALNAATLAQREFFLTAQSRAPETTLFGTPRISLWPIQQIVNSSQVCQSARDKLIHFCATVGGTNYDFQRGQVSLYNGGYQSSPAAASMSTDWNIARNQSVFGYATNMMAAKEPGFGSSLASKWGTSCGTAREMTLAMDMIRSSLSQVGTTTNATPYSWSYRNEISPTSGTSFRGSVMPLQATTSSGTFNGIGRDWRVCSAAIQIIPTARTGGGTNTTYIDGWGPNDPQPATTQIQAILLLNFYNPLPTPQILEPSFRVAVGNTGVGVNGSPIGTGTVLLQYGIGGGGIPFARAYPFTGYAGLLYPANTTAVSGSPLRILNPSGTDLTNSYPFVTVPINVGGTTCTINSGTVTISIQENGETSTSTGTLQTESLYFPGWTGPLPQYVTLNATQGAQTEAFATSSYTALPNSFTNRAPGGTSGSTAWFQPGDIVREVQLDPNGPTKGDYRLLATARSIPTNWFAPNTNYASSNVAFSTWATNSANLATLATTTAISAEIGSMTNRFAFAFPNAGANSTYGIGNGYDSPLANSTRFSGVANTGVTWLGGALVATGTATWHNSNNYTNNVGGLTSTLTLATQGTESTPVIPPVAPALANPPSTTAPTSGWSPTNSAGVADWSTDYGYDNDGAIFSAPDTATLYGPAGTTSTDSPNYFGGISSPKSPQEGVTEPNRVASSPIALFGGLPTPKAGATTANSPDTFGDDLQPWQSMLLCPNPASYIAGSTTHPGFGQGGGGTAGPTALPPFASGGAPDHLFIDLFWMPVVEPYAISDPLSTAGKVNLNYEMEPFTHITRRTALVGVLTPVDIAAITNSVSATYKQNNGSFSGAPTTPSRFLLNLDTNNAPSGTPPTSSTAATGCFTDFETRFSTGDVFRSASEVCTIRLVPTGQSMSTTYNTWWANNALTGLNMRESPYNQIYSRITTKSNTYTVHYWVQSLQQVSTSGRNYATWNENQDIKTGEYRGNTTIERYLDPNTQGLPDYTTVSLTGSYTPIDQYYSWRVVMQKQFAPGSN